MRLFGRAACSGAPGKRFHHGCTRADDTVGTGRSVLSCGTAPPRERSPEEGVSLQRLLHWSGLITEQTCCLVCIVFKNSSQSFYFYTCSTINNLLSKGRACFQTASTVPALLCKKKKKSKQTLSIGRNVSSKLAFPSFQEMLVQKECGTTTVWNRETSSICCLWCRRVSPAQSLNNFFFFCTTANVFDKCGFFLIWP